MSLHVLKNICPRSPSAAPSTSARFDRQYGLTQSPQRQSTFDAVRNGCRTQPLPTARVRVSAICALRRRRQICAASGGDADSGVETKEKSDADGADSLAMQTYSSGNFSVDMPLTAVQQWDLPAQGALFAGVVAALGAGTWLLASVVTPGLEGASPGAMRLLRAGAPALGALYVALGASHFALKDQYCCMMPKQGAWGFWALPGTPEFHVYWTGVAEILGGAGVLGGSWYGPLRAAVPWLAPSSALGLFVLTCAVTPANIYVATHNAPQPGPPEAEGQVVPLADHVTRGLLQMELLCALWGLAHPPVY